MPDMPVLDTDRLHQRPFQQADLDAYTAIVADEEVVKWLRLQPMSREEAWRNMALFLGHDTLRGWSNNAVIEKATGRLLGRCGLWQPEGWPGLEVGWAFGRFAWGHGFATEAALAWRDYAFGPLGAGELLSVIRPDNRRSIAVAERIGHRYLGEVELLGSACALYGQRPTAPPRTVGLEDRLVVCDKPVLQSGGK
jgi:RimJ/RimL family protein N-acetyltransferase